ncbi:ABC-type multidrug transport system, ATPase and permease components [Pasteurella testudinis DSM 23072]|uniref:ABC-type multidrug transport system, ATPase and permease components n=1 Tax=Pasteurella testudinis DSM 23072 TaxID=1122938 RepID=A0A1W1V6L2_9PAST|nr:ABC transporter six-transmembrane domain-containing protein [Pasteurella testudinis]SMB89079.1 ABC-type multidrug transport system, ATPase and permease components [Pasteurella testudinis DSM 23072]SUB50206.1 integral membrane protein [Pasteurella testudinis]
MWRTLKHIGRTHRKKLLVTFTIVALENLLYLIYPLFGAFAVNAVMAGNVWQALVYAALVLAMWLVGAVRRAVDTRTFARIYSALVVPVIVEQRMQAQTHSTISARVALSREFVDFFEEHLPTAVTSLVSVIGACVMLLALEWWSGVLATAILLFFALLLPRFSRISNKLYEVLNNRLEKDVEMIQTAESMQLHKHYDLVAQLRIWISNREALAYLCIGVAACLLFGFTLVWITLNGYGSAGHIYALTTYMWMFAMSLDDMPFLIEKYSNLKDIAERVKVG